MKSRNGKFDERRMYTSKKARDEDMEKEQVLTPDVVEHTRGKIGTRQLGR